jgi:uncharacterized protein YjiS (DUF1127 family)
MDAPQLSGFRRSDMAAFEPRANSFGSTFTLALAGMAIRAVARVMTALKNRRQISSLAELDDRALKDIGLMRSDVHAALSGPFFHDPSVQLVNVAGYKRRTDSKASTLSAQDLNRLRREDSVLIARSPVPGFKSVAC